MFVDRQEELSLLAHLSESGRAELLVLYGRRRTGKTALLRQFTKGRDCLFFSADLSSERDQLAQLTESVFRLTRDAFLQSQPFSSWESALRYIFDHLPGPAPLVIFDEFPYLCSSNRALPSILQKVWDQKREGRRMVMVLCGSTISFMEKEVLGAKSPLYGRRTSQMDLRPFDFRALAEFFPDLPARDRVSAYAVLGGIPAYLEQYDAGKTLEANIRDVILDRHSPLFEEPRFLLMQELNEPSLYFSILKAIAFGKTRLNEIAQETGIGDGHKVNKYISVLRELRIVKREVPATEDKPYKSRKGLYLLADHFFRFWFRYVYANLSSLDAAGPRFVWEEKIKPDLESFTALAFEDICAQGLSRLNALGELPFRAANIGRWWDGRNEIDLIALNGKGSALFCECKWTARKVGVSVLRELESKAALFPESRSRYYGFFSKSGFTPEFEDLARSRGDILLLDWGSPHCVPDFIHELVHIADRIPLDRDRVAEVDADCPRLRPEPPLWHQFERSPDGHGDNGRAGADRQEEPAPAKPPELPVQAPGPLREYQEGMPPSLMALTPLSMLRTPPPPALRSTGMNPAAIMIHPRTGKAKALFLSMTRTLCGMSTNTRGPSRRLTWLAMKT